MSGPWEGYVWQRVTRWRRLKWWLGIRQARLVRRLGRSDEARFFE